MLKVMRSQVFRWVVGAVFVLALPTSLYAETHYIDDGALLAISSDHGRVVAGMMCYAADSVYDTRDVPRCLRAEARRGYMCRRLNSNILNSDILAFDVTSWPREAISELANRLRRLDDPMNYDFTKAKVAGFPLRRIEESWEDAIFKDPVFELSSGCYLLMKVAPPIMPSGS